MDALSQWNSHGERVAHTLLALHANRVTHAHAWAEVGVGKSFRCQALHQHAHHGVRPGIPSRGDHAHLAVLLAHLVLGIAVFQDAGVDVEAVHGVDAHGHYLLGILGATAGGGGQNGYVYVFQFGDVTHHLVGSQLGGLVLGPLAAHDACYLEVGSGLQCLHGEVADVAVSYYGCSDFLHLS